MDEGLKILKQGTSSTADAHVRICIAVFPHRPSHGVRNAMQDYARTGRVL